MALGVVQRHHHSRPGGGGRQVSSDCLILIRFELHACSRGWEFVWPFLEAVVGMCCFKLLKGFRFFFCIVTV